MAAAIGSFYCLAGLSAILYPGTHWYDPDQKPLDAQKQLFSGIIALMWVGFGLEAWRIDGGKGKVA